MSGLRWWLSDSLAATYLRGIIFGASILYVVLAATGHLR